MTKIKAAIFDMDGLLIDSEPFWREAEIKIFNELGVPMTDAMCESVMGLRIDEVIEHWYNRYPWQSNSLDQVKMDIINEVERLIHLRGDAMDGVIYILDYFKKRNIKIALASSSFYRLIDAVLDKLQIRHYFDVIQSAEKLQYGKPHPEIFIHTREKLGLRYNECLVFEDSLHGVIAAKAARMKVVAVPDPKNQKAEFCVADAVLKSLNNFSESIGKELE
ncbi:MAG: hexitol phosphatase HxpB [Bacteroidales bacterium]|nr:hexitol phosphatase HxpB [Bacteroidales bacterium]